MSVSLSFSYSPKAYDDAYYAVNPHTLEAYRAGYEALWVKAKVVQDAAATMWAKKILAGKSIYKEIERLTGVPWWVTGALHMRENGCNFKGVLHNGELIIGTGRKTSLVPKGRGPFTTFVGAAQDALKDYRWIKVWTVAAVSFIMESFNGFGYRSHGIPSPYLYGGSSVQKVGKYIRDGVYSSSTWDPQMGGITVLKRLAEIDSEVAKAILNPLPVTQGKPPVSSPKPPATSTPTTGDKATLWATLAAFVAGLWYYIPYTAIAGIGLAVLGFVGYNIYKKYRQ